MRLSPARWIAIAACTVAAVATQLPATAQPVVTDQACEDAWKGTAASQSCGSAVENPKTGGWLVDTSMFYAKAYSGNTCSVVVDCATNGHPHEQPVHNDVLISHTNFIGVYNCDGTLTNSSC